MRRIVALVLVPLLVALPLCPWAVVAEVLAHHGRHAQAVVAATDATPDPTILPAPQVSDTELPNFTRIARDVDGLVLAVPAVAVLALPDPPLVLLSFPRAPAAPVRSLHGPPPPARGPPIPRV